ncbi:MAG: DUF2760 domain-containing protein [Bryobacteraceae bacterium]
MSRIVLAFRSFFNILFSGTLSDGVLNGLHLTRRAAAASKSSAAPKAAPAAAPAVRVSDGALQLLAILQRDARLVDFLMEDIAAYSDDQIGAAVRELHDQCRDSLRRAVALEPVIDGVEGTFAKAPSADSSVVKFIGNVPAKPPSGGILRHKGWKAVKIDLPAQAGKDATVIAPAEIEIE